MFFSGKKNLVSISITLVLVGIVALQLWYGFQSIEKSNQKIYQTIEVEFTQRQLALANEISSFIESEVFRAYAQLGTLALSSELVSATPERCNEVVKEVIDSSYVLIGSISRVNADQYFDCSTSESAPGLDGRNYGYLNQIFVEPKPGLGVVSTPFSSKDLDRDRYITAVHVPFFIADGTFGGTLGSALFLDDILQEALLRASVDPDFLVSFISDEGIIVAHSHRVLIGESIYEGDLSEQLRRSEALEPLLANRVPIPDDFIFTFQLDGDNRIGALSHVVTPDGKKWYITVVRSTEEVDTAVIPLVESTERDIIFFAGSALLSVILLIFLLVQWNSILARRVSKATKQLVEQIEETEKYQHIAERERDSAEEARQAAEQKRHQAEERSAEAEQVSNVMVGREMKMIQLKEENEALRAKLKKYTNDSDTNV